MTDDLPSGVVGGKTPQQDANNQNSTDLPEQSQPVDQQSPTGGMAKEQMESGGFGEKVPLVELREEEDVPEEVSGWMEKLERGESVNLPQPIVQDDQVLVDSPEKKISEDNIVLPMTEKSLDEGLHKKVYSGARWLAEWCVRLVKKFHGRVVYRSQQ